MDIRIDARQLIRLNESIKGVRTNLPIEMAFVVNATTKKTRINMSRQIREKVTVKAKAVKKELRVTAKATKRKARGQVSLLKSSRLPLGAFSTRQTRKGVSYKIDKHKGRKVVTHAFIIDKFGRNVFIRKHVGGKMVPRLPIRKLYGVSPWGAYVVNNMQPRTIKDTRRELRHQMERRIKFNKLRKSGFLDRPTFRQVA